MYPAQSRHIPDGKLFMKSDQKLTALQRFVETDLLSLIEDINAADDMYDNLAQSMCGRVINADCYRELSPWFRNGTIPSAMRAMMADEVPEFDKARNDRSLERRIIRTHLTSATTKPSSAASKDRIMRKIDFNSEMLAARNLLIVNGGSGSGKTLLTHSNPDLICDMAVTYDTTNTSIAFAESFINMARCRSFQIWFCFVDTPFPIAMKQMIARACRDGRYITATGMANNHQASQATMRFLVNAHTDEDDIHFCFFESSAPSMTSIPLDDFIHSTSTTAEDLTHDAFSYIDTIRDTLPSDLLRRINR
jgi:hypothetical protein